MFHKHTIGYLRTHHTRKSTVSSANNATRSKNKVQNLAHGSKRNSGHDEYQQYHPNHSCRVKDTISISPYHLPPLPKLDLLMVYDGTWERWPATSALTLPFAVDYPEGGENQSVVSVLPVIQGEG